MWNRLLAAFDLFRKAWGFRTLLELVGIWKYVVLGVAAVIAIALQIWASAAKQTPPVLIGLGLAVFAALLLIGGFAVAFWRAGGPSKQRPAEGSVEVTSVSRKAPPAWIITCGCILAALVIVGFLSGGRPQRPTIATLVPVPVPVPAPQAIVATEPLVQEDKGEVATKGITKKSMLSAKQGKGISVGKDSVAMGRIPDGSKIGDGSVVVGATDINGNTVLNQGGLAVGRGATTDPTSIAIGAGAHAGNGNVGSVEVQPGAVASFGQQGGITAGQINVFPDESKMPVSIEYSQARVSPTELRLTIKPNRRIDAATLAMFFDGPVEVPALSFSCMNCGNGRINDADGTPDLKTVWVYWAAPPFTPESAITFVIKSEVPVSLVRISRGPNAPQ
jgi:hypothetical protein